MEEEITDLKKELSNIKKLEETIIAFKEDLKEKELRLVEVEDAVENFRDHNFRQDDTLAILEYNQKERMVRIRGVPEVKDENTLSRIIPLLMEIWGLQREEISREVDHIYRVNTRSARNRSYPRDIVLSVVRRDLKDQLLRANSKRNFKLDDARIIIMKELPVSIQQRRKDYKKLTNLLKDSSTTYRWIIPEGISFVWNGKRFNLTTVPQAQEFLQKHPNLPIPAYQENSKDSISAEVEVRGNPNPRGLEN
ncbi:uncharacterized protein LOC125430314 [Sphaerodactylus townsendi]|uniref:uncharacterized protein LOC125430314 n=1 Tax=Sphaerodactylus townsendi TaxID=933632 RepID=UPI002025ECFD|nr:uncharacterized protein LOC125430314 [Sphaerodactylus townsendi]